MPRDKAFSLTYRGEGTLAGSRCLGGKPWKYHRLAGTWAKGDSGSRGAQPGSASKQGKVQIFRYMTQKKKVHRASLRMHSTLEHVKHDVKADYPGYVDFGGMISQTFGQIPQNELAPTTISTFKGVECFILILCPGESLLKSVFLSSMMKLILPLHSCILTASIIWLWLYRKSEIFHHCRISSLHSHGHTWLRFLKLLCS